MFCSELGPSSIPEVPVTRRFRCAALTMQHALREAELRLPNSGILDFARALMLRSRGVRAGSWTGSDPLQQVGTGQPGSASLGRALSSRGGLWNSLTQGSRRRWRRLLLRPAPGRPGAPPPARAGDAITRRGARPHASLPRWRRWRPGGAG